ncbi:MAG: alkaline phosphatase family protein [Nanoarchaeota archaeon]|nr:alkaline phosphatase family protein [Nanoarchaeota archaeon]
MHKPDYLNSIVNVMSSISSALGASSRYAKLKSLKPDDLRSRNIVLMVIDGLGYEFLMRYGDGTILKENVRARITSAFPSTTASCITSFAMGTAPQQHGITGWHMSLKEIGLQANILPFTSRLGGVPLQLLNIDPKAIIGGKPFADRLKAKCVHVLPKKVSKTPYTLAVAGKGSIIPYTSLTGFTRAVSRQIKAKSRKKFIYAYWPDLDTVGHALGINSRTAQRHLMAVNKQLTGMISKAKNTTFIITADHGLIDTKAGHNISIKKHPKLRECLSQLLCGEGRLPYCYVRPSKAKQFERYVNSRLKHACLLKKSHELVKQGYFGLFKPDSRLYHRVGDYVLMMKDDYVIKDELLGQETHFHRGNHGGLSKDEMYVPLIVIKK